jgi:hypothetical protein
MRYFLLLLLCVPVLGWADTIVFDTSTYSSSASVGSPCTWSMTVGNGTAAGNKAAVLSCSGVGGTGSNVSAASIGGTAFVFKQRTSNAATFNSSEVWAVAIGAASGAKTVSVTPTAGSCGGTAGQQLTCTAETFAGVNQTTPVDVSTGAAAASATSISANINVTNSGEMLVDSAQETTTTSAATPGGSQVQLSNFSNGNQGTIIGASYKGPQGAPASQTMSWSNTGTSTSWSLAWLSLNANPSGGGASKMSKMERFE